MRRRKVEEWVVYRMLARGCPDGLRGVCLQDEWEALVRALPGRLTLIQEHLSNEAQAEQLARGRSGETPTPASRWAARLAAAEAADRDQTAPAVRQPVRKRSGPWSPVRSG
jgi:hypothetical protein